MINIAINIVYNASLICNKYFVTLVWMLKCGIEVTLGLVHAFHDYQQVLFWILFGLLPLFVVFFSFSPK